MVRQELVTRINFIKEQEGNRADIVMVKIQVIIVSLGKINGHKRLITSSNKA